MLDIRNFTNEGVESSKRDKRDIEMRRDGFYLQNASILSNETDLRNYLFKCEKYYEGGVDVVTIDLCRGIYGEILFLVSAYVERSKMIEA